MPGARGCELQDGGAQGAGARGEQALRGRARRVRHGEEDGAEEARERAGGRDSG